MRSVINTKTSVNNKKIPVSPSGMQGVSKLHVSNVKAIRGDLNKYISYRNVRADMQSSFSLGGGGLT